MPPRPTRLAVALVWLFGCSIGPPDSDSGEGCGCPPEEAVFEERGEADPVEVLARIDGPLLLALGGTAGVAVNGDRYPYEVVADPVVNVSRVAGDDPSLPEAGQHLVLSGVAVGAGSLTASNAECERSATLELEVAEPVALDAAASAATVASDVLLPLAAVSSGVGLLPGGSVWLRGIPRDAAGRRLAGALSAAWTAGAAIGRAVDFRVDWRLDLPETVVRAGPGGTGVTVVGVPAGSAASLALADLTHRRLVEAPLEVAADGGVVELAAFARDAAGRLLRGYDDRGFSAELEGDGTVLALGHEPGTAGPLLSVVGLEPGTAELLVRGHGLELRVPVLVIAR